VSVPAAARLNPDVILSTLDKGLHVLEALSRADGAGVTLTQLSRSLGMHRTTLFRILGTLQARGYVSRQPDGDRYRLSVRVLSLASALLQDLDIRHVARPSLEALCADTRELVHLVVLDRGEVVTVERVDGGQAVSPRSAIGARRPAYCTAAGKAILAYLPDAEVNEMLERGMESFTPRTITRPAALLQQLAEVRERGYAWDGEEYLEGVRCVAAPVFGIEGKVAGSVSLAAPAMRTPWERLWQFGEQVHVAAEEISRRLGAPEWRSAATVLS
jgi:DNA-binding IclR family transcriptional regulator